MKSSTGLSIKLVVTALLLAVLYSAGVAWQAIAFLAIFFLAIMAFREWFYPRFEKGLVKKVPWLDSAHPWARRIIIVLLFVSAYYAVKYVAFGGLALAGFDVQAWLYDAVNVTALNASAANATS